jgi:hypothetical protein
MKKWKTLTVKQLRVALANFPDDAAVYFVDTDQPGSPAMRLYSATSLARFAKDIDDSVTAVKADLKVDRRSILITGCE